MDAAYLQSLSDRNRNDGKPLAPATPKGLREGLRSLAAQPRQAKPKKAT